MLRMTLELDGHVVCDASDGIRGLELFQAMSPDVGIIDIGLPGMDGYEIAKRIREAPTGRRMLLVALTGYGSAADATRSTERFDHHLVKPVDADHLTRLIGEGGGFLRDGAEEGIVNRAPSAKGNRHPAASGVELSGS